MMINYFLPSHSYSFPSAFLLVSCVNAPINIIHMYPFPPLYMMRLCICEGHHGIPPSPNAYLNAIPLL